MACWELPTRGIDRSEATPAPEARRQSLGTAETAAGGLVVPAPAAAHDGREVRAHASPYSTATDVGGLRQCGAAVGTGRATRLQAASTVDRRCGSSRALSASWWRAGRNGELEWERPHGAAPTGALCGRRGAPGPWPVRPPAVSYPRRPCGAASGTLLGSIRAPGLGLRVTCGRALDALARRSIPPTRTPGAESASGFRGGIVPKRLGCNTKAGRGGPHVARRGLARGESLVVVT